MLRAVDFVATITLVFLLPVLTNYAHETMAIGLPGSAPANTTTGAAHPGLRVPLDVDNYPVAPSDLTLEQVHVYVRHGKPPSFLRYNEERC